MVQRDNDPEYNIRHNAMSNLNLGYDKPSWVRFSKKFQHNDLDPFKDPCPLIMVWIEAVT